MEANGSQWRPTEDIQRKYAGAVRTDSPAKAAAC